MTMAHPTVIPMLAYEDGVAAMAWLEAAFGFTPRAQLLGEGGRLSHGEMETGEGVIMLATPSPAYQSPRHHRESCDAAREWSEVPYIIDGVLVYVDDATAHFERAREKGATILSALETDEHGKRYRAEDIEGHRWMFMER
jgi:uncharacterized glyoxalase superfamily protein PhnB